MIQKIKKIIFLSLYYITFLMNRKRNNLTVLTYHRISEKPDLDDPLKVSLSTFENQMRFLKNNYKIISGDELAEIVNNNKALPERSCLITFDDGWTDNYTRAFPILKKYGLPAVIFISTDYIETNKRFWYERLGQMLMKIPENEDRIKNIEHALPGNVASQIKRIMQSSPSKRQIAINDLVECLKSYSQKEIDSLTNDLKKAYGIEEHVDHSSMLTWDQVMEMSKFDICFGSHTKSHAILTNMSVDKAVEELSESKRTIELKTGKEIHFVAYPNGNYNKDIVRIAEQNGYIAGFTCISGKNHRGINPFEFRRKHVREDRSMGFNGQFSELFFKIGLSNVGDLIQRWRKVDAY